MKYQRHILLPNLHNFRDLGGYPAADGKMTRWGILYRTDSLVELTQEGWADLKDLGVCCIIDLRSTAERKQLPVDPPYSLNYMGFSLMGEAENGPAPTPTLEDEEDEDYEVPEDMSEYNDALRDILRSTRLDYPATLFTYIDCAAAVLNAILSVLESGDGSIVYMCNAGKDRTGMVTAMLFYLAGVPEEDIVADYMISSVLNTNGINKRWNELIKEMIGRDPDPDFMENHFGSLPKTMWKLLRSFKKRDLRRALSDNGFGEEKQKRLAELITE